MSRRNPTHTDPDAALRRRAFTGTIALSAASASRLGLQLLILPVLARILGPAAFGIVALAMPFILFATMLADGGMGNALIRERAPGRDVESTVFWVSLAVGVSIAAIICACAGLIGGLLGQPQFPLILIAMSPILVISSTLAVPNSRISRDRRFGVFAAGDLISAVLSSAAAIGAALQGWGAWSLVAQQLVLWVSKAIWIWPAAGFSPGLVCRLAAARDLLRFGLHNVGAQVADFAGKAAPSLVIGATLGVVAVGHYSLAYQLIRIPDLVLSGPLFLATFTAISALVPESRGQIAALSLRTMRLVVLIVAPLFGGLALISDLLVETLLGDKWQGTAPALAMLSTAGFFICLYQLFGAVLMGLGRADLQFRLSLLVGGGMTTGAVIGQQFGLTSAALGVGLGMSLALPAYLVVLSRQLGVRTRDLVGGFASPLLATGVMLVAVRAARFGLSGQPPVVDLLAAVGVGVLVFAAAVMATSGRQVLADLRTLAPAGRLAT